MWRASRRTSNIWIADVACNAGHLMLHGLVASRSLPGEEAPFYRLRDLLRTRDFDGAGIELHSRFRLNTCRQAATGNSFRQWPT